MWRGENPRDNKRVKSPHKQWFRTANIQAVRIALCFGRVRFPAETHVCLEALKERMERTLVKFLHIQNFLPKKLSLSSQKYGFGIQDPEKTYSGSQSPGVKKAPDPGSQNRIRNTGIQSTAHPLSQVSPLHTVPPFMLSADFSQLHSVSFGNFMHLHRVARRRNYDDI